MHDIMGDDNIERTDMNMIKFVEICLSIILELLKQIINESNKLIHQDTKIIILSALFFNYDQL